MSKISIIAAVDRRMAIGFQNKLLFLVAQRLETLQGIDYRKHHHNGKKNLRIAAERCAAQSQKRCIIHPSGYGMSRCGSLPVAGSRPAKLQGR